MSYKDGVSLLFKCVRSANYAAGRRFFSAETQTDKSNPGLTSEIDKKAFSIRRDYPEPLPVRYGAVPVQKPAKSSAAVEGALDDCSQVSGVPEEHVVTRRARIFIPSRAAPQSGNNNTNQWKIELDNRERWENQLMGWSSTGDPISNVSMAMDFASKDDAIRFCLRQGWEYEVEEPHEQRIKPKAEKALMASAVTSRQRPPTDAASFQQILDENAQLIHTISEFQQTGRSMEAQQLQQLLHKNLIQLATAADNSLLAELQMPPLSDIQQTSQQANQNRRESGPNAPGDQGQAAAGGGTLVGQHTESAVPVPASTSNDKENRPSSMSFTQSMDTRAPPQAPSGAPVSGQAAVYEQPMHQQLGPIQSVPHPVQQQQQQPTPFQQQVQHLAPSAAYSQQPHQYYAHQQHQHQQQQQQQYQHQQMSGAYGGMTRGGFQTGPPVVAQHQQQQQQSHSQLPEGGYYGAQQQRYQYPATSAPSAPTSAIYQQQPVVPVAGQTYGAAYQPQTVRSAAGGYAAPGAGYNYQHQPGGNAEPQQMQQHQMGPPQNYPQAYHQTNFAQPQVSAGQQMHYQATSSSS